MLRNRFINHFISVLVVLVLSVTLFTGCDGIDGEISLHTSSNETITYNVNLLNIPDFDGSTPYIELNGNVPEFTDDQITTESYEYYSDLDSLGRCGVTMACIGVDIMPTEERGAIGQIKPTGWHTVRYDDLISDKYLYNRCHLIGYQLTGENANENNLITGTRYMNVDGMLPFENEVATYIKETNNHVMYRVTPIFDGDNLVANGVKMEALSVEDNGAGVKFNVFCYNNQPGITIDYKTGDSWRSDESATKTTTTKSDASFVINKNSNIFHKPDCPSVSSMKPQNKKNIVESRELLIEQGYTPCKICNP